MCTVEKRGQVYLLTLTGATEHRLNPALFASIRSALARIKSESESNSNPQSRSALVIAAQGKFFSNGFDLDWARLSFSDRGPLLSSLLKHTISDLLSLPMPTVAAVTGHASAAGMILALSLDYVVMRSDRGFLYLSETDIGLVLPDYFVAVLKSKLSSSKGVRDAVLASRKIKAAEAVEMGMVDRAVPGAEVTVEAAAELAEELAGRGWDGEVYAKNRMAMLPEICGMVGILPPSKL